MKIHLALAVLASVALTGINGGVPRIGIGAGHSVDTPVSQINTAWIGKKVQPNQGSAWPAPKPMGAWPAPKPKPKPIAPTKIVIPRPVPPFFSKVDLGAKPPKQPVLSVPKPAQKPVSYPDVSEPITNFDRFFPEVQKKEVKPIAEIIKDTKWREWVLNNPIPPKRPIYPPVYEPPTDIPPNPFSTKPTTQAPYEPPTTQKPYEPPTTQAPYEPPTTQPPYEPPTTQAPYEPPTTKRPHQPVVTHSSNTDAPYYTEQPLLPNLPGGNLGIPLLPSVGSAPKIYQLIQTLALNRFIHLIDEAGLENYLTGAQPVTVFVPSNEAFEKLPYAFIEEIASNKESLKKFLLYHIISGSPHTFGNLPNAQTVSYTSASGHKLNINSYNQILTVNGIKILQPDLAGSNGVFHIVNDCIYPYVENNLLQYIQQNQEFSTLVTLLTTAGLIDDHITTGGPFTFFAPTNTALQKIAPATLKWLQDNPTQLREYLLQYFTNGIYYSYQLNDGDTLPSLVQGSNLDVTKQNSYIYVNNLRVIRPDITTTNGVIHVLDDIIFEFKVLGLLETLQSQGTATSYFINILQQIGLLDQLKAQGADVTIFVPVTNVFKSMHPETLKWLLANPGVFKKFILNHFVDGVYYSKDLKPGQILYSQKKNELKITAVHGGLAVNGNKIVKPDIAFSHGVIHIIDGALFDTTFIIKNLLETLKSEKTFTIFINLLEKAGLVDAHLLNGGPFTLFAPSDDSLNKIDRKVIVWLLKNPLKLRELLLQHFVHGVYYSSSLTDGLQLPSVQKTTLQFAKNGGYITVNGKPITIPDIHATNGIIHVIDGIFFDVAFKNILETLKESSSGKYTIFLEALENSGLIDEHLTDGGPYTVFVPTDAAFKKIDPATLKWLLWDPETLKALVLKHFVNNVYYSEDLQNSSPLSGIGADKQLVIADGSTGGKTINGSPISDYDVVASNGVIHTIDDVLFSAGIKKTD